MNSYFECNQEKFHNLNACLIDIKRIITDDEAAIHGGFKKVISRLSEKKKVKIFMIIRDFNYFCWLLFELK